MSTYPFSVLKQGGNDYEVKCAPKLLKQVVGTSSNTMKQLLNQFKATIDALSLAEKYQLVLIRNDLVYHVTSASANSVSFTCVNSSYYSDYSMMTITFRDAIIASSSSASKIVYNGSSYAGTEETNTSGQGETLSLYLV